MSIFSSRSNNSANLGKALLLVGGFTLLHPHLGAAQSSPLTQTFNQSTADGNYPFTATPALASGGVSGYFSGQRGASAAVAEQGYGISTNTGNTSSVTVDMVRKTFPTLSTSNQLSFDIGAFNAGSGNKGFNNGASVDVYLSVNNSGYSATPQLHVIGANTNGSNFNFGTATTYTFATPVSSSSATVTLLQGNTSASQYTSVVMPLPVTPGQGTSVAVRFVISTSNSTTILVDNVTLTSSSSLLPLPVELTRFTAVPQAAGVSLAWATASEKNSAYFEVQRSATGETYTTLGKVAAQGGSSSAREYRFDDGYPLPGLAYYRLHQVDNDGSDAFSPVVLVRSQPLGGEGAYPNPTTGEVRLPAGLSPGTYRVLDARGRVQQQGPATANARLDLRALPTGSFLLELTDAAGSRRTQRLVRE